MEIFNSATLHNMLNREHSQFNDMGQLRHVLFDHVYELQYA